MVSSLDGFIAKKDNSVSWFETTSKYEKGVDGEDAEAFMKTVDCFVMGARTYKHALELSKAHGWVYGDVPTFVVTHRKLPAERKNIEFYSGDLNALVSDRLKSNYRNIWMVGGAALTKAFIRLNLADEIRVSILPILLGDGMPFFDHIGQEHLLDLKDVKGYKSGMAELCYAVRK